MAVPTISNLSPATGPAGGRNLVEITGTNFRLPGAIPAAGPVSPLPTTVGVQFGTQDAYDVQIISSTLLRVLAPAYRETIGRDMKLPPVDVVVTNLDDSGVAIPGETVTLSMGYTYTRTTLRDPEPESPYSLILREVLLVFRRQIIPNVMATTDTDFTHIDRHETALAELPAIVIGGPSMRENRRRTDWSKVVVDAGGGRTELKQPPLVEDLVFELTGVSNKLRELMDMMTAVTETFQRTPWLEVDDPALGRLRFDFELTEEPSAEPSTSDSNLKTFRASFEVWGVPTLHEEAYDAVESVDAADVGVQQGLTESSGSIEEVTG